MTQSEAAGRSTSLQSLQQPAPRRLCPLQLLLFHMGGGLAAAVGGIYDVVGGTADSPVFCSGWRVQSAGSRDEGLKTHYCVDLMGGTAADGF